MRNTALSILFGFLFSFFYCEGMDILLKKFNYVAPIHVAVMCDGNISDILSADTACAETNNNLVVEHTTLRNLEILSDLSVVNGSIVIENNSLLNNINGLSKLKYVEKDFIVNDNENLSEAEVRRVILKILDNNEGYIGGSIIFNHEILEI